MGRAPGQSKAYDGLYLACAERLIAESGSTVEFWTADEGQANRAWQLNVGFVRQFGK